VAPCTKRGGIVREVKIERGSSVKKGDELIILDDTDVKNRLAESRAEATELAVRLGIKPDSTTFSDEQFVLATNGPPTHTQ
jgi:multidrug resistance efflux pump